jgi:hypothetical protein
VVTLNVFHSCFVPVLFSFVFSCVCVCLLACKQTNYRPVLLTERAPQDEEQSNCPAKETKKNNLVMDPKGVPDTKTYRPIDRRSQHQLNSVVIESVAVLRSEKLVAERWGTAAFKRIKKRLVKTMKPFSIKKSILQLNTFKGPLQALHSELDRRMRNQYSSSI